MSNETTPPRRYFGWSTLSEMFSDFDPDRYSRYDDPTYVWVPEHAPTDADILLAWYSYEDYDGSAYVLYQQNGELFEVHGGHCSCYGLEGQWQPDQVSREQILMRPLPYYIEDSPEVVERYQEVLAAL